MRISEKLALIDKIARELQQRFSYHEIESFLAEFQIDPPVGDLPNSKWVYSKAALSRVPESVILKLASELDLPFQGALSVGLEPPRNWQGTADFRLFISHISKEKLKATRLKNCLASYAINAFVAHEDIHPTLEWQSEIERALNSMDAFVAMHTPGFANSVWTQQEIGFAVGRGTKIISLRMGEDPTGFISKHQALPRGTKAAEEIAIEIGNLLSADARTKERLEASQVEKFKDVPF